VGDAAQPEELGEAAVVQEDAGQDSVNAGGLCVVVVVVVGMVCLGGDQHGCRENPIEQSTQSKPNIQVPRVAVQKWKAPKGQQNHTASDHAQHTGGRGDNLCRPHKLCSWVRSHGGG